MATGERRRAANVDVRCKRSRADSLRTSRSRIGHSTSSKRDEKTTNRDLKQTAEAPDFPVASSLEESLHNALEFYTRLQVEDGHWAGDYGGPLFLMSGSSKKFLRLNFIFLFFQF